MTTSTFRYFLIGALCLFGSGLALAAPVAYVHELTGNMQVQYGTSAPQNLKIGDTVDSGATLITGAGSNAVVKFEDGQIVAMQPDTRFAVRQYEFVKTNVAKSNSALELLAGGLRFVTGMIGATNRNAFKFTAGTATIGIRGTDAEAFWSETARVGNAATNLGTLAVSNAGATSIIPAENFVNWAPNVRPSAAAPITQAPPPLARAIAQLRAVAMPANTPESIVPSARATRSRAQVDALQRTVGATPAAGDAERALGAARAEAATDAKAASQAAEQTTQEAVRGGAVFADPPAPAIPAGLTAPGAALSPDAGAAGIGSLPVTATPTSTGGGTGGGGAASVR